MATYNFYRLDNISNKDILVETLRNIHSFYKMDDFYILQDDDDNQFLRNLHSYSKVDKLEDIYEGDPVNSDYVDVLQIKSLNENDEKTIDMNNIIMFNKNSL
jgi:hypothetical protein